MRRLLVCLLPMAVAAMALAGATSASRAETTAKIPLKVTMVVRSDHIITYTVLNTSSRPTKRWYFVGINAYEDVAYLHPRILKIGTMEKRRIGIYTAIKIPVLKGREKVSFTAIYAAREVTDSTCFSARVFGSDTYPTLDCLH